MRRCVRTAPKTIETRLWAALTAAAAADRSSSFARACGRYGAVRVGLLKATNAVRRIRIAPARPRGDVGEVAPVHP